MIPKTAVQSKQSKLILDLFDRDISHNALVGSIPEQFGQLQSLDTLLSFYVSLSIYINGFHLRYFVYNGGKYAFLL